MSALPMPGPVFAWAFVVMLVGLLLAAAVYDLRKFLVPKPITLGMLAAGLVMSLLRGALNGADGVKTWHFPDPNAAVGAADGLLFAVEGFLVGFAVYFGFWILGIAGGGDVKVVAALGSWLGPLFVLGAILFTFPVVVIFTIVSVAFGFRQTVAAGPGGGKSRKRLMSYTLPLAIATAALLLYGLRFDLGLMAPPPPR